MSTEWLVYTTVVPALLAIAAFATERLLRLYGRPVRWVWAIALAASVLSAPVAFAWSRTHVTELPATGAKIEYSETLGGLLATPVEPELTWRDALPSVPDAVERAAGAGAVTASLLMMLLLSATLIRLRWERRRWTSERVEDESVLVSGALGPAVVGVVRPAIVLPRWLLSESSPIRKLALAHEREHVHAGDTRMLMLGCVALALAPWSPALWWQVRRLRLAIEMDCDRRVLRAGAAPDEYGAMLLGVAARRTRTPAPALALLHPPKMIERRILAMTESLPRHRLLRAAGLAAAGVFVVALACDVPPPTEPVPPSEGDAAIARATLSKMELQEAREPLFVVDGVIVSGDRARITDLDDIESIEVVKGETAVALYGERARNGLIVIRTQSGGGERIVRALEDVELARRLLPEQEVAIDRSMREAEVVKRLAEITAQRRADQRVTAEEVAGVLRKVDRAQEVEVQEAQRRAMVAEIEGREQGLKQAVVVVPLMKDRAAQEAVEAELRKVELEAVARVKVPLDASRIEAAAAAARNQRAAQEVEAAAAQLKVLVEDAQEKEIQALVRSERPADVTAVIRERQAAVVERAGQRGQPIFMVDGVVLGPGRLNIDALDIESIEVIKGAAAERLYGRRGRFGVISITTKK